MATAVRTAGRIALGLVTLVVIAAVVLYAMGSSRLGQSWPLDAVAVPVSADSASVARGHYIVMTHGCTECHGADLSGQVVADVPPFRMVASNLTSGAGGVGAVFSDEDFERALRSGVRPDGSGLFMMPSSAYWGMSDADIGAVISYLRSIPAVDHELPTSEIKPLGRIIAALDETFATEAEWVPRDRERMAMPAIAPTAEYGYYLTQVCQHCHGADLHGGTAPDPDSPPGLPLDSVKGWTLDQFVHAMRTGDTPDGRHLDEAFMPWREFARMTDDDLTAIYLRLQEL